MIIRHRAELLISPPHQVDDPAGPAAANWLLGRVEMGGEGGVGVGGGVDL